MFKTCKDCKYHKKIIDKDNFIFCDKTKLAIVHGWNVKSCENFKEK
jgi:hypothetical protein